MDRAQGKPKRPQSWNRYAYGQGNPMKYIDPDGRDIRLSTAGNSSSAKAMLVQTMMRPSGRERIVNVANDRGFTATVKDDRINSAQQIQDFKAGKSGASLTAGDTNPFTIKVDGVAHRGATVRLDTAAIQGAHPDPAGVTTTGHEMLHTDGARQGLSGEQLEAQDDPGPDGGMSEAESFGAGVAAEAPDITEREAEILLDILLFQSSSPPPQ